MEVDKGCQIGPERVSPEEVARFANLTGDHNSIHFGPDAIVHGVLLFGKISAAFWRRFGDGTYAIEIARFRFHRPVSPGEDFLIFIGDPTTVISRERLGQQQCPVVVKKTDGRGREKLVASGEIIIIPGNCDQT